MGLGMGGGKKRRNHGVWGCWIERLRGRFPFRSWFTVTGLGFWDYIGWNGLGSWDLCRDIS